MITQLKNNICSKIKSFVDAVVTVGKFGWRTVTWILQKVGLISKIDKVAQKTFGNAASPTQPKKSPQELLAEAKSYETGVNKNLDEALRLYTMAADLGDVQAQNKLGDWYFYGLGVQEDTAKAVELYRKSADQGNSHGQFNLGVCYEHGEGVHKDLKQALLFYTLAAKNGHVEARTKQNSLKKAVESE